MPNFLSLSFWFNLYPPKLSQPYVYILIILVLGLILATFVFWFLKNQKGKSKNFKLQGFRSLYSFSITNAALGLLLLFFNFNKIPFFSARFWYPLWLVEMLVWLYFIFKFFRRSIPEKLKKAEQEEKYKKYLP